MPLATAESYLAMLETASERGFALPGVAVTSSETLNAALRGFADAASDGIIQISPSAGKCASGAVGSMVRGALALAAYADAVADEYPIQIALHTDHCPSSQLDSYLFPLLRASALNRAKCGRPLFNSQMFDGSDLSMGENLDISARLLEQTRAAGVVLEIEIGVIGGGSSRDDNDHADTLTQPEDFVQVVRKLGAGERGLYLLAPAFGNVHGNNSASKRRIDVDILRRGQETLRRVLGLQGPLRLTFHGGSGCGREVIRESIKHGVVKFNVDTDTQYAFSAAVVKYVQQNHPQMLGDRNSLPVKAVFDPRTYASNAEIAMAERVKMICEDVLSAGNSLGRK